jgi:D-3-phosphoglycerate dehydrogenase
MKYYTLNPIAKVGLDVLEGYEKTDDINEADAVLVRSAAMHDLELPPNVKAVGRAGAGVNNIPLDKYAAKGVVVFNTPGANANGVKELVLAGMLLAARDIIGGIAWAKENAADPELSKKVEKEKAKFAGTEIAGKKLGIIGLGAIGVRVANAATHLGMDVYGYDPYILVEHAWNLSRNVHSVKNLADVVSQCDYISLHVPLIDATKRMIGAEQIVQMKENVVLLNLARDLLVDEMAVVEALAAGKIARYVTDFPNPVTAGKKGVIAIPHLGASTEESEDNCAVMVALQIKDYLENGNITNSVNFPVIDSGVNADTTRVLIAHKNIPNMIAQFSAVFSKNNINIDNFNNKSRGEYAMSVLDIPAQVNGDILAALDAIDGVLKVRVV